MIELGRFQIDLEMRTVRRDGEALHLGSRAFDILAVIVSAAGRLVTKDELMNAVWPNTVVEENNIQVHLSALRKILGADRHLILTVPGRGYQLVHRQKPAPVRPISRVCAGRPLPSPKTRLVGRDAAIEQIRAMLREAHVLTLVGAGGIGKTSLAIEAARQAADDYAEPVCFVELATLNTFDGVLGAIAQACGLLTEGATPAVTQLAAALAHRHRLLVLDNAEHVIGCVAEIVEALIAESDSLRVLVTSREPLRIMPEAVFRVDPLDVPHLHSTDAEILQQSAVNLFLLRSNSLQYKVGGPRAPNYGWSAKYAGGWTAFRSQSNWPRHASRRSAWRACIGGWTIAWRFSRAAIAPHCHAIRPCAPPSTGASRCSTRARSRSSDGSRYSAACSRSRPCARSCAIPL
ncbi:winged helix-turn-helix domain-containing protein [Paraburkholderia dipogonis]|uniref:ATP-binding protein n=1 Tax=Paraburkholderia dipogonis TaxID=1211383 RepID=UPI0035E78765